jgi:hypothetical protein
MSLGSFFWLRTQAAMQAEIIALPHQALVLQRTQRQRGCCSARQIGGCGFGFLGCGPDGVLLCWVELSAFGGGLVAPGHASTFAHGPPSAYSCIYPAGARRHFSTCSNCKCFEIFGERSCGPAMTKECRTSRSTQTSHSSPPVLVWLSFGSYF